MGICSLLNLRLGLESLHRAWALLHSFVPSCTILLILCINLLIHGVEHMNVHDCCASGGSTSAGLRKCSSSPWQQIYKRSTQWYTVNINVSSKAKVTLVCSIQLPEGLRPRFCNEHIASSSASGLCGSVEPGIECERLSCESCWSSVETFMTPGPPGSRNREVLAKGFGKSLMRHTGYPCRAWPHLQSPEALLRIHPKNLANHMNDWSIRRWDGDQYTKYFPQKTSFSSSVGLETQFSSHHSQLLSELRMASVLSAMGSCTSSLGQAWYTGNGTNMKKSDPVSMNPVLIESPIIHETQQSGSPGIPFCIPILSVETHSWSTKLANWAWLRVLGEKLNKWITRVQLDDLCLV